MPRKTIAQTVAEKLSRRTRMALAVADRTRRSPRKGLHLGANSDGRKRAEVALEASEERYRRLFETARDGILILDAKTGRITDSNPYLEQMLGYSQEELLGKRLWDLGAFGDIPASRLSFRELQREEYIRYDDLPLESKEGERRQVEFVSNVYVVDRKKLIQCNIRDITHRKRSETQMQQANETLSSLVTTLRQSNVQITQLKGMNEDLQRCEAPEDAYRVIGLAAAAIFGGQEGCLAVFHPSGQYMETVARWGEETQVKEVFSAEDCWAMRRGLPYESKSPRTSPACSHFIHPPETDYLCLPLIVQGEALGVLHLVRAPSTEEDQDIDRYRLAVTVGETIKLALADLRQRKALHEQATRDPLTGLFNRRYLEATLPRELHRTLRRRSCLSLAMLDLDHFKQINDTSGHDGGDEVLRVWGRVLSENLRGSDIACRYGGEEFVLVLPDSSLPDAKRRLERVRLLLETLEIPHQGRVLPPTTLSAGIAVAPEHGSSAEELLRAADAALYAAKHAGRNGIAVYQARD